MIYLLSFYCIFSYLFLIGIKIENDNTTPIWLILIAPISFPILLGVRMSQ